MVCFISPQLPHRPSARRLSSAGIGYKVFLLFIYFFVIRAVFFSNHRVHVDGLHETYLKIACHFFLNLSL